MHFEYDIVKSERNKADPTRGKDFEEAKALWTIEAPVVIPHNVNSGETVWMRAAIYEGRVWAAMYVEREKSTRILSFRRLNARERREYGFE
jgi:uncharacterized DUF497 family protein